MEKLYTEEKLQYVASQLRCPNGEKGLDIADEMHRTNINMTLSGMASLELASKDRILEIGPGSCKHLESILQNKNDIQYYGLETSILMKEEAQRKHYDRVLNGTANFFHYGGKLFPFESNYFDAIITINTIYFWDNPALMINQIYNVLKPKGICNIVFAEKKFMKTLPFAQYDFRLYGEKELRKLLDKSLLEIINIQVKKDFVKNKMGDSVERVYLIASLTK